MNARTRVKRLIDITIDRVLNVNAAGVVIVIVFIFIGHEVIASRVARSRARLRAKIQVISTTYHRNRPCKRRPGALSKIRVSTTPR
jgi:hypothetical protein